MQFGNVEDVYALSPMQEGMLFHTAAGAPGVYVTQVSALLVGELNEANLERVWEQLVARHTSLRTAFLWDGLDEPLQVVRQRAALEWHVRDWRGLDPGSRRQRFDAFLREDRARGFDLEVAPLMRMALFRIDEREWHWIWSLHHLIADGWSTRLLLREMSALYSGSRPRALSEPFRFRDYIAWHARQDPAGAKAYWRNELAGFTEPNRLDILRPETGTAARARQAALRLSRETSSRLRALAAHRRITLSTIFQGAWGLLLSCYSGDDDVVFGVTSAGRPPELEGVENAIGLFINTLPLRARIDPRTELFAWLQVLQDRGLERQSREASPLQAVQGWSELGAGEPLFDSVVVFENHPQSSLESNAGFELRDLDFAEQSNYPLALLVVPGKRIELVLVYDEARVEPADAERLPRQLEALLSAFVEQPDSRLGDLPMLTPAERTRILVEWNDTRDDGTEDAGIYALVEQEARRAGERTAVTCGNESVSYSELVRRAEHLARQLTDLGVGEEMLVGLHAERSIELIVGMLGILAAGGAYLPLDPGYPPEYLRSMLDEASPSVVLTQEPLLGRLPSTGASHLLLGDAELSSIVAGHPAPLPVASADPLAYVIYTSGSSGLPKGVEVTQRNLVSSTLARRRHYEGDDGRFLLLSSFAFDSSVAGIFWTLTSGGTLVLEPGIERDLEALAETIRKRRITHTLCLPALYEVLLEEAASRTLDSLETVIVAGEACPPSLARAHHAALPATRLFNEYGPTEATVWSTVHEIIEADGRGPVPIGRPIANTRIYVLDERKRPLPTGVAGELYIAGAGVARGYLGHERLTAERFVTLDLDGVGEQRAYRTGDRVRYRDDGSLLFLGRTDSQVKIRGYRIEPEGVQECLRRHPDIGEAAVAAIRPAGEAPAQLVAWVAPPDGAREMPTRLEGGVLRDWLGERLPDFSIPDRIVVLARLPHTASGKIDYRALPAPSGGSAERRDRFVAPRTGVERELAAIWSELLGVARVGLHDNFFELGGDSILSIQVVSRIRQAGYAIEPRHVAIHPTLAELAAVAEAAGGSWDDHRPTSGELPLLPIQAWFLDRQLVALHHWNQAQLFELPSDFDADRFADALRHCIDHHDMLRARFVREPDDRWRQEIAPVGTVFAPLSVVDLSSVPESERSALRERSLADIQAGFDLAQPPLLRAAWIRLADGGDAHAPDQLLLSLHHLVVDLASWPPLLADLHQAYRQLESREPVTLPARTVSFQRWATSLADSTGPAKPADELEFWLSALPAEGVDIPVDFEPERPPSEADARTIDVELDRRLTDALLRRTYNAYGTRVDELLATALVRGFRRWSGRTELRLAVEGHGRPDDLDTSRTVGWFTVSYPVELSLAGAEGPGPSIQAIKEQLRAVPGDGRGFGVLRYLDRDGRAAARLAERSEPQVLFNFLSRVDGSAGGSPWKPIDGAQATCRDPRNARSHLLEINAAIREERLSARWTYCLGVHRRETIERVAGLFIEELESLIEHCLDEDAGGVSTVDFPAAELEAADLERLLDRLESGKP